jgi:glycosyltransferase involved in cell wall biosynthesis
VAEPASRKLRIAHVLGALDYGGVENMALLLMRRLPADQFEHDLIYCGRGPAAREAEFRAACRDFRQIPYRRFRWLSFMLRLRRYFRDRGSAAVLCHNFGHHPWIGLAARWAGVRAVYTIVASSPAVSPRARVKNWLKGKLGRLACKLEIAVSPQVAAELQSDIGLPHSRIRTILNCCLTDEIAHRAEVQRQKPRDQTPTLVMVARMEQAKDHGTLLRAAALLAQRGRPVRLLLPGDGPLRHELAALAAELGIAAATHFLGIRHDIPELLGGSDLFVLASRTEGLSVALIEAMSAAIPVISSDLPSCREVLEEGRCGLLVPVGDPQALAAAIARLLDDPALVKRLVEAAGERVKRVYDPQQTVDQYARLLRGEMDEETPEAAR